MISADSPIAWPLGRLALLTKLVSNLTSGMKRFESHTASLLQALPSGVGLRAHARIGVWRNLPSSLLVVCPFLDRSGPRASRLPPPRPFTPCPPPHI